MIPKSHIFDTSGVKNFALRQRLHVPRSCPVENKVTSSLAWEYKGCEVTRAGLWASLGAIWKDKWELWKGTEDSLLSASKKHLETRSKISSNVGSICRTPVKNCPCLRISPILQANSSLNYTSWNSTKNSFIWDFCFVFQFSFQMQIPLGK